MADFDIERPTIETQPVQPTYNVNPPQFTIELNGSTPGQRGEKGDPGQDGVDGTNGIDGIDGVGIASIEQTTTSTESGGTNIITATLTNGESSTFEIMNGEAGTAGGIEELEDPIILKDLDDGYYRVPSGLNIYGYEESLGDIQYTTKCNTLLSITHTLVPDPNDPDTKYDAVSYFGIHDATEYTDDGSSIYPDSTSTVKVFYGVVCDDTGDEWKIADIDLIELLSSSDVINNLTSNSTTKPLSAAQGKVLKEMISNFDFTPWFATYDTVTDASYHGSIIDGKYNVTRDAYILDDNNVDAYINTEAIMHRDSNNTWGRLDDVLDAKANTTDIPTNTSDLNNDSGFITSETDPVFSASAAAGISSSDISNWNGKSDFSGSYNDLTDKPTLFSGDYTDLTNKPTIPDELSDLSDDTTHRLVTDTEKSTWSGKQDTLVSGTNIKTINNNSILGSGDLTISGGGSTDVKINGTSIVQNDEADIQTEGIYDASTNKIATMSDIPDTSDFIDKDVNNLTNYSLTTNIQTNKNLTKGVEYIVGTQASATNAWTGTSTDTGCSSGTLYTGKVIIYHLPVAGSSSAATLNLTLPDGTTTGAKNIYRQASSTVTTTFAADCDILMVYDGTQWKVNAYVDTTNSNSIGYQLRTDKGIYVNGASTSIYRYQLLVQTENGLEPFTSTSNKTGTTKTQLSPKYLPGGDIRYYSSTTEITTGSDITSSSLWMQYHLDLRYSFNITSTTLTAKKPVYMKMSVNADGTLSPVYSALSGGHPLTQTLPTTADGYVYLHLGTAYSGYQLQLEIIHPMYEYKNGKLREYISETGGGGTLTDVQVNSTSVVAGGVANVLTETAYDASTNKIATMADLPSVPTVNDATLTIQKNGTSLGTFTANASSNKTINVTVPTKVSEITNDSNFVTSTNVSDTIKTTGYNSTTDANLGAIDIINVIKRYSGSNAAYLNTDSVLYKDSNNNNNVLSDVIDDLKQGTMEELTSPVSLKDLSSGVYKVPANCTLMAETGGQTVKTTTYGGILIIAQQTDAASFVYIDNEQTITPDYDQGVITSGDAVIGYGCIYDTGPGNNNEYDYIYEEKGLHDILEHSDIVDNLTTNNSSKALSAAQGKVLKDTIDGLSIPTKTSDLTNNGAGTGYGNDNYAITNWNQSGIYFATIGATVAAYPIMGEAPWLTQGRFAYTSDVPSNSDIVDLIYPVGSIYMSVNSTSPQTLFGGTWQQIEDTFLLSAGNTYTAGNTGGAASHTLTTSELPAHTHGSETLTGSITIRATDSVTSANSNLLQGPSGILSRDTNSGVQGYRLSNTNYRTAVTDQYNEINVDATHEHDSVGNGDSFSTLPPYLVVYMWKRTA